MNLIGNAEKEIGEYSAQGLIGSGKASVSWSIMEIPRCTMENARRI